MKEVPRYKLNTGRIVRGCREMGCYSASSVSGAATSTNLARLMS